MKVMSGAKDERKGIVFEEDFICFHGKHGDIKCSRIDGLSQTFNIRVIEFVVYRRIFQVWLTSQCDVKNIS